MKNMINNLIAQVQQEFSPEAQEGKTIIWHHKKYNGGTEEKKRKVIVAGCEYDIGITLQTVDGDELTCLNKKEWGQTEEQYAKHFWVIMKFIIRGYYDVVEKNKELNHVVGLGSMSPCAFK